MIYKIENLQSDPQTMGILGLEKLIPFAADTIGNIFGTKKPPPPPPATTNFTPILIAGGVGVVALVLIMVMKK